MELLGPEYSLSSTRWIPVLKVFFSRNVKGKAGEDLVEKQNAEIGLMPVVANEETEYGYTAENRHFAQSFLAGQRPAGASVDAALDVAELLMTAYMSAEKEKTIPFPRPASTATCRRWRKGSGIQN